MRDIVIEKVKRDDGGAHSPIDPVDCAVQNIGFDERRRFTVRMAAPGFATGQMRIVVTENAIKVQDTKGEVLRQIALPEEVDPRTICAVFDNGFLELTAATFDPAEELVTADTTRY
jgi:HSP20 family molecular chaperone IbpA